MTLPMLEDEQYPHRWNDYIGQTEAKEKLRVAAKSARLRNTVLDHVLIADPEPGIGKTALAVLTAAEMKRPTKVVSGALTERDARWILSDMQDGHLLVCDEFHRLFEGNTKAWAWLLNYMQDGVTMGPLGMEVMPKVTLVAITTEDIPDAVTSRFMIRPALTRYTDAEATRIAQRMAASVLDGLPDLSKADAQQLVKGASNNPRAIKQLLTVLRDLTVTETLRHCGRYDIPGLLKWEGVTVDGLDRTAQRYLITLATEFGGSAGQRALVDRIGIGLASVERLLMDRGYIAKTRTGRALTTPGMVRVRALMAEQEIAS